MGLQTGNSIDRNFEDLDLMQFVRQVYLKRDVAEQNGESVDGAWDVVSRKYGAKGETIRISIDKLTIRSPIVRDLSKLDSVLSIAFLERTYKRLKTLEKKYKDETKSLDALLR